MVEDRAISRDAPYIRYHQIDTLRGFAVLGIYWINIFIFGLPGVDYLFPPELNDESFVNSSINLVSDLYIEGTMRGLFSILFGASALIFLDEAKLATSGLDLVDRYYRRAMILILFGIIHAYLLLWPYDVLYAYGLFGLFLFPLRKLSVRALLICAIILLALGDLEINLSDFNNQSTAQLSNVEMANSEGSEKQLSTDQTLEKDSRVVEQGMPAVESDDVFFGNTSQQYPLGKSVEEVRSSLSPEIYHSNYYSIFILQRYMVMAKQTITIYQDYIFDIGGMMLLGMALYKMGILTGQVSSYAYLLLMILGYVSGSVIRYILDFKGLGASTITSITTGYNLGRVLITLGHVGLIGLLCRCNWLKMPIRALASVGRMALTNYIMQTVISIFIFYGFGFGFYSELERYQLTLVCISVWLFQITYSNIWLYFFKQGPLEWIWRSLIYGQIQPNRKSLQNN